LIACARPARFAKYRPVATALRERASELRLLDEALFEALAGRGSTVLVSGEAGIGKTSVARAFLRDAGGRARLLVGACDDLLSPGVVGATPSTTTCRLC
jgi:MoxR-like ATPase